MFFNTLLGRLSSRLRGIGTGGERLDAHLPLLAHRLVLNHAVDERVDRIVAAQPDVAARPRTIATAMRDDGAQPAAARLTAPELKPQDASRSSLADPA